MRRATIITLDRLLELRLVRWLGLLRRGRGLRLRAMQSPTTSGVNRAFHRLQDRPNPVCCDSRFFHYPHPPSVRFVFQAPMLSAIGPAKLLLLGHCEASFQTLRPHNRNRITFDYLRRKKPEQRSQLAGGPLGPIVPSTDLSRSAEW